MWTCNLVVVSINFMLLLFIFESTLQSWYGLNFILVSCLNFHLVNKYRFDSEKLYRVESINARLYFFWILNHISVGVPYFKFGLRWNLISCFNIIFYIWVCLGLFIALFWSKLVLFWKKTWCFFKILFPVIVIKC